MIWTVAHKNWMVNFLLFITVLVGLAWSAPASANGKRVALLIGNAKYTSLPALQNPSNDVTEVAAILRKAGFDVISEVDQNRLDLDDLMERFFRSLNGAEVSLFYYSGHAVQLAGANYIIPTDANLASAYDIELQTVSIETILSQMRAKSKTQLVFLDACRDNPFRAEKYWIVDKLLPVSERTGLAQIKPGAGSLISFSTEPGNVAYDGTGRLSPFTGAFISRALTPNQEVRALLTQVRRDVIEATGGRQVPWENSSLTESFFFLSRGTTSVVPPVYKIKAQPNAKSNIIVPELQNYDASGTIAFDLLPERGQLTLSGQSVAANQQYPAVNLSQLIFDARDVPPGFTGLISYTASDRDNHITRGFIAISIEEPTTTAGSKSASPDTTKAINAKLDAQVTRLASLFNQRREVIVGVGPVPIARSETESEPEANLLLEVVKIPEKGVLSYDGSPVQIGERLNAGSIGQLSYEPQIGTQGQTVTIEATFAPRQGEISERYAQATLEPVLHRCDTLAGEPLDLQGVAPGVLPNEIDVPNAITACTAAMREYPRIPRFRYQLGRAQLAGRNVDAAWRSFEESAQLGHTRALHQLGYMYAIGAARPVDRHRANEFYKQNADRGDPYGIYNYGRALFYGYGMNVDTSAGLELMLRAAEIGHTYAMNELGAIFLADRGVPRDSSRAIEFYKAGVARKDIYSYNNLALAYLDGNGAPTDLAQAYSLFRRATDGGHPAAPGNIGRMYRDGLFLKRDNAEAARWFEIAANRGDSWSAASRAELALEGKTTRHQATAAQFFALAIALDRRNASAVWREKLRLLPRNARLEAARTLAGRAATKSELQKLPDEEFDKTLVQIAREAWQRRNPRVDLF